MKITLAAFAVCAVALGASTPALSRPMSSEMRCGDVQRMIAHRGSVVLGFTGDLYDRVVSNQRYCLYSEALVPISVPTRDGVCLAGYTCREGETRRR